MFPVILFAQASQYLNPASTETVQNECNDRVFTKVQVIPSLKISKESFEDMLIKELKSRKFRLKESEITYKFIITSHSNILDFRIDSGIVSKENVLRETLMQLAGVWNPATQNNHAVCAFVRLKLIIKDGSIQTEIFQ